MSKRGLLLSGNILLNSEKSVSFHRASDLTYVNNSEKQPHEPHLLISLFKTSKLSLMGKKKKKKSNSLPIPGQGDSLLLSTYISAEPCDWVLALT